VEVKNAAPLERIEKPLTASGKLRWHRFPVREHRFAVPLADERPVTFARISGDLLPLKHEFVRVDSKRRDPLDDLTRAVEGLRHAEARGLLDHGVSARSVVRAVWGFVGDQGPLTEDQTRDIVTSAAAGVPRAKLAERYGIGLSSGRWSHHIATIIRTLTIAWPGNKIGLHATFATGQRS
jgi:hypothetical protein